MLSHFIHLYVIFPNRKDNGLGLGKKKKMVSKNLKYFEDFFPPICLHKPSDPSVLIYPGDVEQRGTKFSFCQNTRQIVQCKSSKKKSSQPGDATPNIAVSTTLRTLIINSIFNRKSTDRKSKFSGQSRYDVKILFHVKTKRI